VLRLADYISSTTGLIEFVQQSPARTFIVATKGAPEDCGAVSRRAAAEQ
jgi:quinolinate synthase